MISSYQVIFCLNLYVFFVDLTFLINIVSKVCNLCRLVCSDCLFCREIFSKNSGAVCNFQSMKCPVELNSLFSKFFYYTTWFVMSPD